MILTQKDNVTLKDAKCDKLYGRAICLGIIVFLITIFSYKFILQDDYEKYKSIEGCTNVFGWNAEILWLSIGLGLMLGVLYLLIVFSIKIKKDTNKMYFINKAKEVKKRLWIYIVASLSNCYDIMRLYSAIKVNKQYKGHPYDLQGCLFKVDYDFKALFFSAIIIVPICITMIVMVHKLTNYPIPSTEIENIQHNENS